MVLQKKLVKQLVAILCFAVFFSTRTDISKAAVHNHNFWGIVPKLFSLSLKDYDLKSDEGDEQSFIKGIDGIYISPAEKENQNILNNDAGDVLIINPDQTRSLEKKAPSSEETKRPLNFYTISELNQKNFGFGTYETEGYVVFIYHCYCPKGALCKPCMQNNIIVSTRNQIKSSYSLSDQDLILFSDDIKQFDLGKKYTFIIQILDVKSTFQTLNNLKLIYAKKQDN